MSYMTRKEYDAAIGGYSFLEKAARKFADDFKDDFVGGKHGYLDDIDIEGDEITGEINMGFSVSYCGCCSDYESCTVPISYLWEDDWRDIEKAKREEQIKLREGKIAKEKVEEDRKREKRRYQNYLAMKEEYEK